MYCNSKINGSFNPRISRDITLGPIIPHPPTTPFGSRTTKEHEQHHVDVFKKYWNAFAKYANSFEGKCYCSVEELNRVIYWLNLNFQSVQAQAYAENAQYDVDDYGGFQNQSADSAKAVQKAQDNTMNFILGHR